LSGVSAKEKMWPKKGIQYGSIGIAVGVSGEAVFAGGRPVR
jgi:hypothetical protein